MPGFDTYNQKMSSALQLESKAYLSYKEFTGHIANYDEQQIYDEYARYSKVWREDLKGAQEVYSPYTKDISGRPVRKISQFTIEGNNKALEAINIYDTVFVKNDLSDETLSTSLTKADTLMRDAILAHDRAIDLLDEQSDRSVQMLKNLMGLTLIAGIMSLIFYVQSRRQSTDEKGLSKTGILKGLSISFLWMFLGSLITSLWLREAIGKGGGEYFLLFIPLLLGTGAVIRRFYMYWTKEKTAYRELK